MTFRTTTSRNTPATIHLMAGRNLRRRENTVFRASFTTCRLATLSTSNKAAKSSGAVLSLVICRTSRRDVDGAKQTMSHGRGSYDHDRVALVFLQVALGARAIR